MDARTFRQRMPRLLEILDRGLDIVLATGADETCVRELSDAPGAVALSFDDGPSAETTPAILDLLASHGARASFFVIGERIAGCEDVVARIVDDGHELANHTFTHPHTRYLSPVKLREEIDRTNEAIAPFYPNVRLVRPPFGKDRHRTVAAARERGMLTVLWSVDSGDTLGLSAEEISDRVLRQVRAGSIILLHDGSGSYETTVEACAEIIPALVDRGLELTTISELLRAPPAAASVSSTGR